MGADGEPEDPDRLVIADENGENRLKQETGYDPTSGGGQYSSQGQGMFPSNGTDPKVKKERKKHNRFNGMSDEEVAKKILPDLITPDLDILIVSIGAQVMQPSYFLLKHSELAVRVKIKL